MSLFLLINRTKYILIKKVQSILDFQGTLVNLCLLFSVLRVLDKESI